VADEAVVPPAPGKHALYSEAGRDEGGEPDMTRPAAGGGAVTVTCERCGARTRIGWVDLALFQLPLGYWWPRGRFDRRMTCPACRRRVWASVTLRRSPQV
jgi:hypothetical protein